MPGDVVEQAGDGGGGLLAADIPFHSQKLLHFFEGQAAAQDQAAVGLAHGVGRRRAILLADTAWSPARVLRERKGHCMEGALVAAAALRVNGHPALLMDLESVRDDDHVVALYRERGLWGGIAKSNFAGLRFRAPVYRTLRELALSYFESYFNLRGERTLRSYSVPVNLKRLDRRHWMTAEEDVWCVPELLIAASHYPIVPDKVARALPRLDRRSFEAGKHGWVKH